MYKKGVIFDLDDTLYDYQSANKYALKQTYKVIQKHAEVDSFHHFVQLFKDSKREITRELAGTAASHNRVLYFQRLIEKTHCAVRPATILKLYNTYWDTLLGHAQLFPGSVELLRFLASKNIPITIVTDHTAHVQLRKIESLGIAEYINYLVTSEEAGFDKPHPYIFLLALHKMGMLPVEVMMIGDSLERDVVGANAVGIDTVHVDTQGIFHEKKLDTPMQPKFDVKDVAELTEFLKSSQFEFAGTFEPNCR
ncbi:MAG: HAD family hydrolase [Candidatus Dojkabacteria bacterium]